MSTPITNSTATTDTPNRYNICQRSGFRAKPGELVKDAYGEMVLPEFADSRHDQEFVRVRAENQQGAKRPEPIGSERFVDVEYPNGVQVSDL